MADPSLKNNTGRSPKVIVFDLDNTLWPFYVDSSVSPPFRKEENGNIVDRYNTQIKSFTDAPAILEELHSKGYTLAIASRVIDRKRAENLLDLLGWSKYFEVKEIHPGSKVEHLTKIHDVTGAPFKDILFFDDNPRTIAEVREKGVSCVLASRGVNKKLLESALKFFSSVNKQN